MTSRAGAHIQVIFIALICYFISFRENRTNSLIKLLEIYLNREKRGRKKKAEKKLLHRRRYSRRISHNKFFFLKKKIFFFFLSFCFPLFRLSYRFILLCLYTLNGILLPVRQNIFVLYHSQLLLEIFTSVITFFFIAYFRFYF